MAKTDLETSAGIDPPVAGYDPHAHDDEALAGLQAPQWKPLDGLCRWVVRGVVAQAAVLVVVSYAGLNINALAVEDERALTGGEATFALAWLFTAVLPAAVLFLATGAVFLAWFRRAYRNLWSLGAFGLRSPGWAIGCWFLPFANLVLPKRMADEIWRGSEPDTLPHNVHRSSGASSSRLVTAWWALWMSLTVLKRFERWSIGSTTGESVLVWALLGGALAIGSLVSFALVVTRITNRQHARARLLGLEPAAAGWEPGSALPRGAAGASGVSSRLRIGPLGLRLTAAVAIGLLATGPVAAVALSVGDGEPTIGEIEDELAAANAAAADAAWQDEQTLIAVDKACADFAAALSALGEPEDLSGLARYFATVIEQTATRDAVIASAQFASPELQAGFASRFQQPVLADTAVMDGALRPVLDAANAGDGYRAAALLDNYPETQGTVEPAVGFAEEQGMYSCAAIFRPPPPEV